MSDIVDMRKHAENRMILSGGGVWAHSSRPVLFTAAMVVAVFAGRAETVETCLGGKLTSSLNFRRPSVIPTPAEIEYRQDVAVVFNTDTTLAVTCPDKAAVAWIKSHIRDWYGFEPRLEACFISPGEVPVGDESYLLSAKPGRIAIAANTLQGVRNAAYTLRQSAERMSVGLTVQGWWMPELEVHDKPALGFRGIHLCWFPGITKAQMERNVRLMAYYKLNYAVIEPWGVFKWKRNPAFCWPDADVTADDMKRIVGIGRDLGITLIPQLNVFGHAAMSRQVGGKHATLDFGREYEPIFEPAGGWNWCLTNPETRRILFDMMDELLDAFENPPYFHIGCDEAEEPSCPVCRAVPYAKLVADHIMAMHDRLAKHNARAMMWHDMLLRKGDSRWNGFYANGNAATAALSETLPRDVVVCDWYYSKAMPVYPTLEHFKRLGFETLTCPWLDMEGIAAQGMAARKLGLKGILGTTWNHAYGKDLMNVVMCNADAGWCASTNVCAVGNRLLVGAGHLRQIGWDMKLDKKESVGFNSEDVPQRTYADMFLE